MMMNVIIGQYVPGESFIHRLDSRAKLLSVFIFILIIFLANNWVTYGVVSLFTISAVLASKVPIGFVYRGLKPIILIILFTFILNLFFVKTGDLLFHYGWFEIYEDGLIRGIFIALRLLTIIIITTLLTLTTTPIDITDGLETLLGPLKRWHVPVHEFALMMSISLRFIPTLLEETDKIMKAQTARGTEFSSGSISSRIKAIIPLLVPLFISAFKRAEDLALAMEARGYRGGEGRTRLRILSWRFTDSIAISMTIILTLALLIFRG